MRKLIIALILGLSVLISGCKSGEEMKGQLSELSTKVADHEKKVAALEAEVKKTSNELEQTKGVVSKLSDVVIGLQHVSDTKKARSNSKHSPTKASALKKTGSHGKSTSKKKRH